MDNAIEAEGYARAFYRELRLNRYRRFDPLVAVTRARLQITRGRREDMLCNAVLCSTPETPSGFEIELAYGLSYPQKVYEIAHECAELILIHRKKRPELCDDPEGEAWARALVELAAECLAHAIACPMPFTRILWRRYRWQISRIASELYVPEAVVALRLANLRQVPVAIVRGGDVTRSDWWDEPLYDEQIVEQARAGIRQVIELTDENGYAVLWWGDESGG